MADRTKEALQRISRARAALILDRPFWAHLALRLGAKPVINHPIIRTMAVDGKSMYFNPEWVVEQSHEKLITVVAHEATHVMLLHPTRRGNRDHGRFNVACLSGETPILMADGSTKEIRHVSRGDSVQSPYGPSLVIDNIFRGTFPTVRLEFDGGAIWATPDHRFLSDEGFADAEILGSGMYSNVFRATGRTGVLPRELSDALSKRPLCGYWRRVREHLRRFEASRVGGESLYKKEREHSRGRSAFGDRPSIFSWVNRRRGNDIGLSYQSAVLSPLGGDIKYVNDTARLAAKARVYSSDGREELPQWPSLLEDVLGRLSGRRVFGTPDAVSSNKTAAREAAYRVHCNTTLFVERSAANGTYVEHCVANSLAERARVAVGGAREARPVYDLVTEHHVFVAGGLLTHNCDHATNLILKAAGFHMPKDALCDPQFANMAAEQIYPLIPEPPPNPQSNYGGMGCVVDPTGEDGKPLPQPDREELEREWKIATLQAAQAAKSQGNLPACLEGLIEAIKAPQVDWRAQLREFVRQASRNDYSWKRPNSRFLATGDYLPSLHDETIGPLAMGVDTSGSVSQQELEAVCSELNAILDTVHPESVAVVYCDAKVHHHELFEADQFPVKMRVVGRGGTNLSGIWPYLAEKEIAPCMAIVTTDMRLRVSDLGEDPGFPVLFVTTDRPQPVDGPVSFGTVIKLDMGA